MWLRKRPVIVGDKVDVVKTYIIYYVAIHADLQTLRGGTSYVLGTERMFCEESSVLKHDNHNKKLLKFNTIVLI